MYKSDHGNETIATNTSVQTVNLGELVIGCQYN